MCGCYLKSGGFITLPIPMNGCIDFDRDMSLKHTMNILTATKISNQMFRLIAEYEHETEEKRRKKG